MSKVEKEIFLKIIGIMGVIVLIANMILFALGKITGLVFWGIIIVGAVLAFVVVPRMKK